VRKQPYFHRYSCTWALIKIGGLFLLTIQFPFSWWNTVSLKKMVSYHTFISLLRKKYYCERGPSHFPICCCYWPAMSLSSLPLPWIWWPPFSQPIYMILKSSPYTFQPWRWRKHSHRMFKFTYMTTWYHNSEQYNPNSQLRHLSHWGISFCMPVSSAMYWHLHQLLIIAEALQSQPVLLVDK
jgi:hypothetical protein